MAPEILKCKLYDSKVDLWSVGVILHGLFHFLKRKFTFREVNFRFIVLIRSHIWICAVRIELIRRIGAENHGRLARSSNSHINVLQINEKPAIPFAK